MTEARVVMLERIASRIAPLATLGDLSHCAINDVVFDNREVRPGALFCCLPGAHHDGHDFAGAAAQAGAVAFICEHSLPTPLVGSLPQLVVAPGTARRAMALAACEFFGDPATAMTSVGITGTNGKTTSTYLLRAIFEQAGLHAGVLGTLDGARTTPESPHLQRALANFRDDGIRAVVLEVTSHALVQARVDGMVFDAALFTNLTLDHLDFHQTMEDYFEAKAMLFTPERARLAIVNGDDPYGRRLLDRRTIPTVAFSLDDVHDLEVGVRSSTFRLGGLRVHLPIGGRFNVMNALGAAATGRSLGIAAAAIVAGLEAVPTVPGRFEAIDVGSGVTAVVDFAHTPTGLEEVLRAARQAAVGFQGSTAGSSGRVLVVFGCGGDRDRGKRPAMGAIAGQLADEVFLTSDNPRSEDPMTIISEIQAGLTCGTPSQVEPDRRRAIALALRAAHQGDVVVVAGKGHETTQQFSDHAIHFDDREVVREVAEVMRRRRVEREATRQDRNE